MAIAGVVGAIWRSDGTSTVMTDEATTKDAVFKRYQITATTKRFIDDSVVLTVKKNGVVQTSGFTIEYAGGYVVFTVANITSDVITVTGAYLTMIQASTFFDWKLDITADLKDVTTFASNGWKEQLAIANGWSASANGYWADAEMLNHLGQKLALILYVDDVSLKRYEGYIVLKKSSITEAVDDVVKEQVDFEGTGQVYYHE